MLARANRAALAAPSTSRTRFSAATVASFAWLLIDNPETRGQVSARAARRDGGPALRATVGVGLLLATLIYLSVGPDYRTLADETNLLSTAFSFHLERRFSNITESLYYFRRASPHQRGSSPFDLAFSRSW